MRGKIMSIKDLFKKKDKTNEKEAEPIIHIEIDNGSNLFKDEKEAIIEGAKQFLKSGKFKDLEEAILYTAIAIRGLKIKRIDRDIKGEVTIVLTDPIGESKKNTEKDER
jgi:hypothetical protein